MPQVLIKRSSVAGKVPTTTDLTFGELGMNTTDGKLYFKKKVAGVDTVVDISTAIDMTKVSNIPSSMLTIMGTGHLGAYSASNTVATVGAVQSASFVNSIIFG